MVGKQPSEGIRYAACALVLLLAGQCAFAQMRLFWPVCTNGQFQFTLFAPVSFGQTTPFPFALQSSPDMVNWTTIQTNVATSHLFLVSIPATNDMCFYRTETRVVRVPYPPPFTYALGALTNINIHGFKPITDSYNSADTNLSTNGQYDPAKTSTNGNLGCVEGIVNLGGSIINGSLFLGPTATYASSVTNVTGTIYSNYNVQFPDVFLPTTDTNGNTILWQTPTEITSGGKAPHQYDFTSANNNGYYLITNSDPIVVEAGVKVTLQVTTTSYAPFSITINGGMTNSGTIVMYHNPGSFSGSAVLGGNSTGGPIGNRPVNFIFIGLPNVNSIALAGSTGFVGAIYAPEAFVSFNGGGSMINVDGSIIVGQATVNGHFFFHFDESLLTVPPFGYNYFYTWP